MREVVQGDKHNLRKSAIANCNAQISVIHSLELILFPIVFGINLKKRERKRYMVHHHQGGSCRYTSRVPPSLH